MLQRLRRSAARQTRTIRRSASQCERAGCAILLTHGHDVPAPFVNLPGQEASYEEDEEGKATLGMASKFRKKFAWDKFGGREGARDAAVAWAEQKRAELKG